MNKRSHERDRSRDKRRDRQRSSSDEVLHNISRKLAIGRSMRGGGIGRLSGMICVYLFARFSKKDFVFRKEDEPSAKGLNEADLSEIKVKMQKENEKKEYLFSSQLKHQEARMESASIKQQKQKQKSLNQKLIAIKEQISYYPPQILKNLKQITVLQSIEKDAHTSRIEDDLGCYYTSLNEIPNQPTFQILNNSPSPLPIPVHYEKTPIHIHSHPTIDIKDTKPIKSILKEPFNKFEIKKKDDFPNVNPKLVAILQQITKNRDKYSKENIQSMLNPFKESGDLAMLKANSQLYDKIIKQPTLYSQDRGYHPSPPVIMDKRPNMNPAVNIPTNQPINPIGYNKADKFRTVPCKYYHSSQGCVKKDDCTYIHDEEYAGKPTPNMQRYIKTSPPTFGAPPYYPPINYQSNSMPMDYNYYPSNVEFDGRPSNQNFTTSNNFNSINNYKPPPNYVIPSQVNPIPPSGNFGSGGMGSSYFPSGGPPYYSNNTNYYGYGKK